VSGSGVALKLISADLDGVEGAVFFFSIAVVNYACLLTALPGHSPECQPM
jgi:hypothetical protein